MANKKSTEPISENEAKEFLKKVKSLNKDVKDFGLPFELRDEIHKQIRSVINGKMTIDIAKALVMEAFEVLICGDGPCEAEKLKSHKDAAISIATMTIASMSFLEAKACLISMDSKK